MVQITIRKGKRSDSAEFLNLVEELAKFEKLAPPNDAAKRRLIRDIFIKRRLSLLVALVDGELVGYALYYFTYSSFLAKPTLYLEDLFIKDNHRRRGIGTKLFFECVKKAKKLGCGRMEWAVLNWNKKAIKFYEGIGARRLTEWYTFRLDEQTMENLGESFS
jgi:GNAT superfamily N-acetyltransferase